MSPAARLDVQEQDFAVQLAQHDAAALDVTAPDIVIDLSDPEGESIERAAGDLLPAADTFENQTDDPAMLFVYIGSVLFMVLVALSAVLAFA